TAPRRPVRAAVRNPQNSLHAGGRRGRREGGLGAEGRPAGHPGRPDHPQAPDRRASSGLDGAEGGDEPGRPAPRTAAIRLRPRGAAALLRRAPCREAGDHRLGADKLSLWRLDRGRPAEAGIRPLLRQELHAVPRPLDPPPDDSRRHLAGRGALMIGFVLFWSHALAAILYGALAVWQLRNWSNAKRNR